MLTYIQRKRLGLVRPKPRHLSNPVKRAEVARQYLRREKMQRELALEYGVSQSSIARIVKDYTPVKRPTLDIPTAMHIRKQLGRKPPRMHDRRDER